MEREIEMGTTVGMRTRGRSWTGPRARAWLGRRLGLVRRGGRRDAGMSTSEYAMGTIAACAFAAVLYKVVTSEVVSAALQSTIGKALDAPF
ncbi:DUF4244 domain-containing protein [Streptomyces sp. NPDC002073]|uniref:DUF4244 domain-containing protein n=1 Tax=Streptomyces sp. NBC_00239 TaxID=2903640 RepID=UPI002E2BE2EE|nr:DUF4244 domain-containing protein [Streptomyces sp. NBC_00239]